MQLKSINLKAAVNRLEDGIIILSGPTLAVSGILAGVDLVTGGHVMQSIPMISLAWAICLLISLDFQVLNLAARAHRVYLSKKNAGRKGFEIILSVGIAAAISYVSIQMQSIIAQVNSAGVSIPTAALQLGISPVWLIWERSALVLVLIFLSGWLREDEGSNEQQSDSPVQSVTSPQVQPTQPDMITLIEHMDTLFNRRIEAIVERVTISIVQQQQLQAPAAASIPEHSEAHSERQNLAEVSTMDGVNTIMDASDDSVDAGQRIRALLEEDSTLSGRAIALRLGCSPTTANKWKSRIEQEQKVKE
jgi:hypothetical protein